MKDWMFYDSETACPDLKSGGIFRITRLWIYLIILI